MLHIYTITEQCTHVYKQICCLVKLVVNGNNCYRDFLSLLLVRGVTPPPPPPPPTTTFVQDQFCNSSKTEGWGEGRNFLISFMCDIKYTKQSDYRKMCLKHMKSFRRL
jgi:hypothetical protein